MIIAIIAIPYQILHGTVLYCILRWSGVDVVAGLGSVV